MKIECSPLPLGRFYIHECPSAGIPWSEDVDAAVLKNCASAKYSYLHSARADAASSSSDQWNVTASTSRTHKTTYRINQKMNSYDIIHRHVQKTVNPASAPIQCPATQRFAPIKTIHCNR